ncbi:MAG: hypothetical protein MJ121_04010 [Clostridia bacterium]|nr:hypothetical protein [Clostridia bacterium]
MKKTISFVLSVLVLIASICAITAIVYADDGDITFYDVYVGGVRVNSENMDDILGNGTVAYTPASGDEDAKLTIANTTISSAYAVETEDGFAVANIVADESLQVEFIGNNYLSAYTYSSIANNAEIYDDTLINLNAIYICDSAEEKRNLTISGDYAFINSNVAESVAISVPDNIYFDAKKVETSGRVVSRNNGNITLQSGAFVIINRKDDTKNAFGSSNIVIDSSLDANEIDSYYATTYGGEYIQSTISDINSYTADNEGAGICKLYIGVHIYFYLEGEPVTYKNIADPRYDESVTYDKETKTITLHDNVQIQNNTFLASGEFEKDQKIKLLSGIVITEAAEGKAFTNIPNIEATGDATFKCTQVATNGLNYTSEGNLTIESYGSTQWGSVIGGSQAVIRANNIDIKSNRQVNILGAGSTDIYATGSVSIENKTETTFSLVSSSTFNVEADSLTLNGYTNEYGMVSCGSSVLNIKKDITVTNEGTGSSFGSGNTEITAANITMTGNGQTVLSGGNAATITATGDITVINAGKGSAISSGNTKISCVNLTTENNSDDDYTISGGSTLTIEATGDVSAVNKGESKYYGAISSGGTTITAKSLTAEANSTSGSAISGGSSLNINCTGDVTVLNSAAGSAISSGNTTINCANLKTENNGYDNTISGGSTLTIEATGDVSAVNKGESGYCGAISSGGTTITAKSLKAEANSTGGSTISGGGFFSLNCTGDVTVLNSAAGSAISSGNTTINCANLKTENNGYDNTISGGSTLTIEATGDVSAVNKGESKYYGAISSGGTTITAKSLTAEANSTGSGTISGGSSLNINCTGDVNVSNLASNSAISSGGTTIKAANITATSDGGYSATISGGNSLTIEATGKVKVISNPEKNGNNAITSGGTKITAGSLEAKTKSGAAAISGGSSLVIDCKGNVDVSNASTGNAISGAETTVKGANITVTSNGNSNTIAGGSKVTMTATGDITVLNTAQENGGTAIFGGEASLSGKSLTVTNSANSPTMATGMKTTLDFTGDIAITNKQNGTTVSTSALDIKNAKNVTIEANCQGSAIPAGSISINATGDVTLRNNMKEGSAFVTSCGDFNVKADSLKVEGYSNNSAIFSNGTTKIETNKNVSMRNNGSFVVVSTGKLDIVSGGNVDITAAESSGTVIAGGSGIKIDAKGSVTVKAESGEKSNGMLISAGGVDIKAASFNAVGYTNGESMFACGNGLVIDVTGDANITNNGNGSAIAGNAFNVKNAKNVTVTSNSNNYTVVTGSVDVNAENSAVILTKSEKGGAVSSSELKATANNVVIKGSTSGPLINCGSANIKADEITIENANKDGVVNSCPITVSLKSGGDIYTSSGDKLSNAGASTTIPAGSTGKISAGTHTTHAYVVSKQVAATCTKAGYVEKTCSACGEKETTTIAALGHVDKNKDGYCDRCKVVTDKTLINPCRNAKINVAAAKTVDYRSKVTIKATATGVPEGYYLVMTVNGKEIKGSNTEVSYDAGNIKGDVSYSVKVVDAKGNVQKDSAGNALSKDGGKITCNAGFFKKIIAFFKSLFGSLPVVTVKP